MSMDIARHEAAHCLAAWRNGCIIQNVTVTGPTNGKGTPYYAVIHYPETANYGITDARIRLKTDLAAGCLERGPLSKAAINDAHNSMLRLTLGGPEVAKISANAAALLDKFPEDYQAAAAEFFELYKHQAAADVTDEPARIAIEHLAKELKERGRLSGYEAVTAIEKAWTGNPPIKAKPAKDHPTGYRSDMTPENALEAARRLLKTAFEILVEHDETERAAHAVLNAIFTIGE
jgi:hypothetical protein